MLDRSSWLRSFACNCSVYWILHKILYIQLAHVAAEVSWVSDAQNGDNLSPKTFMTCLWTGAGILVMGMLMVTSYCCCCCCSLASLASRHAVNVAYKHGVVNVAAARVVYCWLLPAMAMAMANSVAGAKAAAFLARVTRLLVCFSGSFFSCLPCAFCLLPAEIANNVAHPFWCPREIHVGPGAGRGCCWLSSLAWQVSIYSLFLFNWRLSSDHSLKFQQCHAPCC